MFPQSINDNPEQPNNNSEAPLGGVRPQGQQPKKAKESFAIRPHHFQTEKGLRALYSRTLNLKLDQNSQINVEGTMKRIVMLLKNWHFEMVPKYSFEYFLQRCQILGTSKQLSAYMAKMRRVHKGTDTWEEANPEREGANNQEGVNSHLEEEGKQAINMMNAYEGLGPVQMDEEDREWMEMMEEVNRKQKEKKQNQNPKEESNQEEPYVPQGFQFDFSESQN